jgi:hypothetical protein
MDMFNVLNGRLNAYSNITNTPAFDAEAAVPFPLDAVHTQLNVARVMSDEVGSDPDMMELAVLFSDEFGESISIKQVREAKRRADARIEAGEYEHTRQAVRQDEFVAAYGRDYAFRNSSFRRQYDAVKWYSTVGLHAFGVFLVDTCGAYLADQFDRTVAAVRPRVRNAKARIGSAIRSRLPGRTPSGGDTEIYESHKRSNADEPAAPKAD